MPATVPEGGTSSKGDRRNDLEALYQAHHREIRHYLKGKFGAGPPEPEDIVQQVFAQFAALEDPTSIQNPRAFLYRSAINLVIEYRRREQRREELLLAYPPVAEEFTDDLQPERVLLSREGLKLMESVLMGLPERDRTLFLLNRVEGLSFAEIARRCGMSPSGVRFVVEQTLEACQRALQAAYQKR